MAVQSAVQNQYPKVEAGKSHGLAALAVFLLFLIGLVTATGDFFHVGQVDPRPFWLSLVGESLSLVTGSAVIYLGVQRFIVNRRSCSLLFAVALSAPLTANILLTLILVWSAGLQTPPPILSRTLADLSTLGYALTVAPLAMTAAISGRPPVDGKTLGLGRGALLLFVFFAGAGGALAAVLPERAWLQPLLFWLPFAVPLVALFGSLTNYVFGARRDDRWAGYAALSLLFLGAAQVVGNFGFQTDWPLSYLNPLLKLGAYSIALFVLLGERPAAHELEESPVDYVGSMLSACHAFRASQERSVIAEALLKRCFDLSYSDYGSLNVLDRSGSLAITALLSGSRPEIDVDKYKELLQVHRRDLRNVVVDGRKTFSIKETQDPIVRRGWQADPPVLSSFLAIPLVVQGECVGFIALAKEKTEFSADDRNAVELLCQVSGLVIENAEVPAEIKRVAEEMVEGPKKMESQLRGKIVELEVIVESVSDGLIVLGPTGTIVRHNAAAEKILGRQVDEGLLVPLASWRYWRPMNAFGRPVDVADSCLGRALFEGEESRAIYTMESRQDETVSVEVTASPINDQSGRRSGAVATFHLVERVEAPRRPMMPVEKLLPTQAYGKTTTNLVDVVLKVVELWQSTTQDHHIKVRSQLPKPTGQWDPRDIERVVGDLLQRAIDRSPEGGDIDVTVRQKDGEAQVIVKDYGVGRFIFPQADGAAPRLAGAIAADDSLDPDLVNSQQIVLNNGGRMWAERATEQGTTIVFTLPTSGALVH